MKHTLEGEGHNDEFPPRPDENQAVEICYTVRTKDGEIVEQYLSTPRRIRLGDNDMPSGQSHGTRTLTGFQTQNAEIGRPESAYI